jgi:hypothetical protein
MLTVKRLIITSLHGKPSRRLGKHSDRYVKAVNVNEEEQIRTV